VVIVVVALHTVELATGDCYIVRNERQSRRGWRKAEMRTRKKQKKKAVGKNTETEKKKKKE
jgi:hypothetical protein